MWNNWETIEKCIFCCANDCSFYLEAHFDNPCIKSPLTVTFSESVLEKRYNMLDINQKRKKTKNKNTKIKSRSVTINVP